MKNDKAGGIGRAFLVLVASVAVLLSIGIPAIPSSPARAETAAAIDWTRQFNIDSETETYVAADSSGIYVADLDSVRKYNADGDRLWSVDLDVPGGSQLLVSAISAYDGDVYLAGNYFCSAETSSGDFCGGFILKYDAGGTEMWSRYLEGEITHSSGWGVHADGSGAYLIGNTVSVESWDEDGFLRKFDASGNELWFRYLGFGNGDSYWGVCAEGASVYVSGSTFEYDSEPVAYQRYLSKWDTAGNEAWTRHFNLADFAQASPITADPGGVYIADGDSGRFRKYDTGGNEVWARQLASGQVATAKALCASGGALYVAGSATGALAGQTGHGGNDAFISEYDTGGNEIWVRQFGSTADDSATAAAVDDSGMYVAGSTSGAMPSSQGTGNGFLSRLSPSSVVREAAPIVEWTDGFENCAGAVTADAGGVYVVEDWTDPYLADANAIRGPLIHKYDVNGREVWTPHQLDDDEVTRSVAGICADSGSLYVTGGVSSRPDVGSGDYVGGYLRKYDSSGGMVWECGVGDIAYVDGWSEPIGVMVDSTGVYVTGGLTDPISGTTGGFVARYNAQGEEMWLEVENDSWVVDFAVYSGSIYVVREVVGEGLSLCKYDPDYGERWHWPLDFPDYASVEAVSADSTGVYLAGSTKESEASPEDGFVRKYDSNGVESWTVRLNDEYEGADAVSVHSGSVYVAGTKEYTLADDYVVGYCLWIHKYDDAGKEVWTGEYDCAEVMFVEGFFACSSGIYLTACFVGNGLVLKLPIGQIDQPPAVTTGSASSITQTSATLNGNLTSFGSASSVEVSFEWGLTTAYGTPLPVKTMNATGAFSATVSGLTPGTTYHFRAKAVAGGTTVYGDPENTFTTGGDSDTSPPTVNDFGADRETLAVGESIRLRYSVSDSGGSGLKQVELWQGTDSDGDGQPDWPVSPTGYVEMRPLSGQEATGSFDVTLTSVGTFWYGIHVLDNAGNMNDETNSATARQPGVFGPVSIVVLGVEGGEIHHILISPSKTTVAVGMTQDYSVAAYDSMNRYLGDVTSLTNFRIDPAARGLWKDNVYASEGIGSWAVIAIHSASGLWATADLEVIHTPVLLVHGFQACLPFGSFVPQEIWRDMASYLTHREVGQSKDYGMVRFDGGGYVVYISNYSQDNSNPTKESIRHYAAQLAKEIEAIRMNEGVDKVDIVAHSMGGLISRAYIESSDFDDGLVTYHNDVRKLVMLGTPNWGLDLDRLINMVRYPLQDPLDQSILDDVAKILADLSYWPSAMDITGQTDFINDLNGNGFTSPSDHTGASLGVKYSTIAGLVDKFGTDGSVGVNGVPVERVHMPETSPNWHTIRCNHDQLRWTSRPMVEAILNDQPVPSLSIYSITPGSPIEVCVMDSQGRRTGSIQGQVFEEIPDSNYDAATGSIALIPTDDSYVVRVQGTSDGSYGLTLDLTVSGEYTGFHAKDIPVVAGAINTYAVDWQSLSQGQAGVTVQIDSDGDGEFERTLTSDGELTADEFQPTSGHRVHLWVYPVAALGGVVVLGVLAGAIGLLRRRRARSTT